MIGYRPKYKKRGTTGVKNTWVLIATKKGRRGTFREFKNTNRRARYAFKIVHDVFGTNRVKITYANSAGNAVKSFSVKKR